MKKSFTLIVLFSLLVSACSTNQPQPTPASAVTELPTDAITSPIPSEIPTTVNTPEAPRQAVISELENDVQVRLSNDAEFSSAKAGMTLPVGASLQTGDNSRASLTLLPEGTIVRVAPNSTFTISIIESVDGSPKTKLQLTLGKIWILLAGGDLDVETELGVASVRGSLLSVDYDPDTKTVRVTCLEGHCKLHNSKDDEEKDLTNGEATGIDEDGNTIITETMSLDEFQEWLDENPDALEYFDGETPEWLIELTETAPPPTEEETSDTDSDGDGVPDSRDNCNEKTDGPVNARGCPISPSLPDSDEDGFPDETDECPTQGDEGYGVDQIGCPFGPP